MFHLSILAPCGGFVDLQQFDRLVLRLEAVDAYNGPFAALHFLLIAVAGRGDFALRETRLDGRDHASHAVDAPDVVLGRPLRVERQLFHEEAAAQRIGRRNHAAFVSQHLLGAQRQRDCLLARQRVTQSSGLADGDPRSRQSCRPGNRPPLPGAAAAL